MKVPYKIKFLDMTIQDTGNGDGVTIVGTDGGIEQCSVGNFSDLITAKVWATRWFMIQHPVPFAHHVWQRMNEQGGGCSREFSKFKQFCEQEGIAIPSDISHTNDMNQLITCCGFTV